MSDGMKNDQASSGGDSVDDALNATSIVFGLGGTALSVAFPPAGVVLGLSAGAVQLTALVRKRLQRKASEVADGAQEWLGPDAVGAIDRVLQDEELAALMYQSIDSSIQSHDAEHARVIGHILGDAMRSVDPLQVDEGSLLVEALRGLDGAHLVVLARLSAIAKGGQGDGWLELVLQSLPKKDEAIATAIATGLDRAGLVRLDPPSFGGFTVTALGRRILQFVAEPDRQTTYAADEGSA